MGNTKTKAERKLHHVREAGAQWATSKGPLASYAYEFLVFGIKQGWACLFGGLMCFLLLLTAFFYPEDAPLARYDFLVLAAVIIQFVLLATGMETKDEAIVILIYHIVGTIMEIFKTQAGSWIYPEESVLRIGAVPLFSGFMYAAVGSYIARVWRLFDFQFTYYPRALLTWLLAIAIYINFFSHHFILDIRYFLFAATALVFLKTFVHFRTDVVYRSMPLLVGFFLVSLFIWFAENIGTYARAWAYPGQENGWHMVSIAKLGSWYLLMVISFVLVSLVNPVKAGLSHRENR